MTRIRPEDVVQDSGDFYVEGKRVFISSIRVTDGDIEAAKKARAEFDDWVYEQTLNEKLERDSKGEEGD